MRDAVCSDPITASRPTALCRHNTLGYIGLLVQPIVYSGALYQTDNVNMHRTNVGMIECCVQVDSIAKCQ